MPRNNQSDVTKQEGVRQMSSTNRGSTRETLDAYRTPDALARALVATLDVKPGTIALEPSAGGGAFCRALAEHDAVVFAIDIEPAAVGALLDYLVTADAACQDFLAPMPANWPRPHLVCGNPPFDAAEAHVRRALEVVAPGGTVAFLLRLAFLETRARLPLWQEHPPSVVHVLVERPSFTGGGTDSAAYAFICWKKSYRGATRLEWISWKHAARPSLAGVR